MGQASSKLSEAIFLFKYSPNYKIIKSVDEPHYGVIKLIEENETQRRMYLKELIFTDKQSYDEEYDFFSKRASISHPHIVHILGFNTHLGQNFCSKFFKILIFVEVSGKDLQQQLKEHMQADKPFSEAALLLIAENLISALAYLQTLNLSHGDIRPFNIFDAAHDYKLFDPSLSPEREMNGLAKAIIHGQKSYLSPALISQVPKNQLTSICNKYKDDVFSLGVTLLSLASLTYGEDLYNYESGMMAMGLLQSRLEQVKKKYSMLTYELIRSMLAMEEKDRPDFQELQKRLIPYQDSIRKGKSTLFISSPREKESLGEQNINAGKITPEKFERETLRSSGKKIFDQESLSGSKKNFTESMEGFIENYGPLGQSAEKVKEAKERSSSGKLKIFDDNEKENISTNYPSNQALESEKRSSQFQKGSSEKKNWMKESQDEGMNFEYGTQRGTEREMNFDFPNPFDEEEENLKNQNQESENLFSSQIGKESQNFISNQGFYESKKPKQQEELMKPGSIIIEPENVEESRRSELRRDPTGQYTYANLQPRNEGFESQKRNVETEKSNFHRSLEREWTSSQGYFESGLSTQEHQLVKPGSSIESEKFDHSSATAALRKGIAQQYASASGSFPPENKTLGTSNILGKMGEWASAQGFLDTEFVGSENPEKFNPENIEQPRRSELRSEKAGQFDFEMATPLQEREKALGQQQNEGEWSNEQGFYDNKASSPQGQPEEQEKPGGIIIERENIDSLRESELRIDPTGKFTYAMLTPKNENIETQEKSQESEKRGTIPPEAGEWKTSQGYLERKKLDLKDLLKTGGIIIDPKDALVTKQSEIHEDPTHQYHYVTLKKPSEFEEARINPSENLQQNEGEKRGWIPASNEQEQSQEMFRPQNKEPVKIGGIIISPEDMINLGNRIENDKSLVGEQGEQEHYELLHPKSQNPSNEMTKNIQGMIEREFNYEFNRPQEQEPIKRIEEEGMLTSQNKEFNQAQEAKDFSQQRSFEKEKTVRGGRQINQEDIRPSEKEQIQHPDVNSLNLKSFLSNSEGGTGTASQWIEFTDDFATQQKPSEDQRSQRKPGGILIEPEDAIPSMRSEILSNPKYTYALLKPQSVYSKEQPDLMNTVLQDSRIRNEQVKQSIPQQNENFTESNYEISGQSQEEQTKSNEYACELLNQKPQEEITKTGEFSSQETPFSGLREHYIEYKRDNQQEPIKRDNEEDVLKGTEFRRSQREEQIKSGAFSDQENLRRGFDPSSKLSKSYVIGTPSYQDSDLINRTQNRFEEGAQMSLSHDTGAFQQKYNIESRKDLSEMNDIIEKALKRTQKTLEEAQHVLGSYDQENYNPNINVENPSGSKKDPLDLMNASIHTAVSYYTPATPATSKKENNPFCEMQSQERAVLSQEGNFPQMNL